MMNISSNIIVNSVICSVLKFVLWTYMSAE